MLYECPHVCIPGGTNPFLMRGKSELGLPRNMITPVLKYGIQMIIRERARPFLQMAQR